MIYEEDVLNNFATKFYASKSCRNCESKNFTVQIFSTNDSKRELNAIPVIIEESGSIDSFKPVIIIECNNCGLIDFFSKNKVEDWLIRHKNVDQS